MKSPPVQKRDTKVGPSYVYRRLMLFSITVDGRAEV